MFYKKNYKIETNISSKCFKTAFIHGTPIIKYGNCLSKMACIILSNMFTQYENNRTHYVDTMKLCVIYTVKNELKTEFQISAELSHSSSRFIDIA